MIPIGTPEIDICKAVADATVIFGGPGCPPITRNIIEAASHLSLIQMPGARYDEVDITAANERGVPVATTKGSNASGVAKHAIMFMLVLLKKGMRV